jgi:hypothetical protein
MVGLDGIEPSTSRLSGVRSNRTELQARLQCQNGILPTRVLRPALDLSKLDSDSAKRVFSFLRKEVIQPQVPLRLPCYDFTPIINHTMGTCLPCGLAR